MEAITRIAQIAKPMIVFTVSSFRMLTLKHHLIMEQWAKALQRVFCRVDIARGLQFGSGSLCSEQVSRTSCTSVLYIHLRQKLQKRMHSAGRQLNGVYE
jgi:hypothetical protein